MPQSRASQTIATIEKALESRKSTAVTEVIKLIQELASKAFSISVSELSELIGRDPSITAKLIGAANTLGFNPSRLPISTISEAIHAVGFERIRNLAISLLLVENADNRLSAEEQREAAAMAVGSGIMARHLAAQASGGTVDAELAFVCASLRNYGKLLMTSFLIDQYREAKTLASGGRSEDEAFREVFGLTPLQLGQYLLASANLPKLIMASLRDIPQGELDKAVRAPEEEVALFSEMSVRICEVAFDERVPPEGFSDALRAATGRFAKAVPCDLQEIESALGEMETCLRHFNRTVSGREDSLATRKLRARIEGRALPAPPPPKSAGSAAAKAGKRPADALETGEPRPPDSTARSEAAAEAGPAQKPASPSAPASEAADLTGLYQGAAEAMAAALGLDDCLAFLRDEFGKGRFSARSGVGKLFHRVRNRPVVGEGGKDIFGICLARGEDILIQDATKGRIQNALPDWIRESDGLSSFALLPVKSQGSIVALLFGSVSGGRSLSLEPEELLQLRQLRRKLAAAEAQAAPART